MDSFFSLFDPSEGHKQNKKRHKGETDNVKKKAEGKGRRRGKKTSGKNETLPEESSFLCEPDLSTELLVKDVSYIENFIEVNKKDEGERKPKRRNSGRKSRRKKKTSKDTGLEEITNWNNLSSIQKATDDNIGKNVNDLSDFKGKKRKINAIEDFAGDKKMGMFRDQAVYNVIDKLEKVSLKDDVYLAGDFNTKDLDDVFYSDGVDEFVDSESEPEDSEEEVYGSLPPEPRFGNVEYKLQLVSLCERRFQHLVTQLKWRLISGGGSAVYVLGVRDCGALVGLRARALRASLCALRRMASALAATLTHVTARRVAPYRAVAEAYIRKLADPHQSVELRVAVMGANEAGKSTLIGVLTQGELDNGRGSARLNMFRHLHEVKSGRTSSLSHEILGFDAQGDVVNYGCSELMTAERIGERSAKLVAFLDLAGHTKYQRTTLHGLSGYSPHHAMLVISATAGVTRITEEHIGLLLALDLPFFAVISKCELASYNVEPVVTRLASILASANKKPLLITDENAARNCVGPQKLILDSIDNIEEKTDDDNNDRSELEQVPVFPVSCVRGVGLNSLHAYLLALQPRDEDVQPKHEDETCEFQIDEIFHIGDTTGPVVGGLLVRGQLREGDNLILGPLETGEFVSTSVRSIYRNRVPSARVRAGQCASLGLRVGVGVSVGGAPACAPRPGMVLLAEPVRRPAKPRPSFGGCGPHSCKSKQISSLINAHTDKTPRKNVRHKNKNIYQELEDMGKEDAQKTSYLEGEENSECTCSERVMLEDPDDPRGCIYFQASVHVLRHSTAIHPGFQCTIHVGNVRQTAIIEGILSYNSILRAGEAASVLFRFVRCPEYLVKGRRLLFTAGLGTRAVGRVTQVFPYIPHEELDKYV